MFKVAALVVLVLQLPEAVVLGQSQQCEYSPDYVYLDQDGDHIVYPVVNCMNDSLTIQLHHSYDTEQLDNALGRILNLFYECTSVFGNVTAGQPSRSYKYPIDNTLYDVSLSSLFTEPGFSCLVYGCFQPTVFGRHVYPIQNRTCTYEESSLASTDSFSTTTISFSNFLSPLTTIVGIQSASVLVTSTTHPTNSVSVATSLPTLLATNPHSPSGGQALIVTAAVIMVAAAAMVVVTPVVLIIRAHLNQRRKLHILRYYNYSEPIDPFFNPVDIHAKVKKFVSLESLFDTLVPWQLDSGEKSKALGVHIQVNVKADSKSMESMTFHDKGEPETDGTDQEETKSVTKELAVVKSTSKPSPEIPLEDGYVPSKCLSSHIKTGLRAVPNGYVADKYRPSAIPVCTVQPQSSDSSAWNDDLTCDISTSSSWNGMEPARPLILSPVSNGYVADLSSPIDRQPSRNDSGVGVASSKPLPQPKYSTLENGYTVVESQQYVAMETKSRNEDSNSAVYSIDEGVSVGGSDCESLIDGCEGVEGVTSECGCVTNVGGPSYTENIVTECSLSLNPLHFEPVDDPLPEQTIPVYVNTSADNQFLQSAGH